MMNLVVKWDFGDGACGTRVLLTFGFYSTQKSVENYLVFPN
jgi:hypothetical protein